LPHYLRIDLGGPKDSLSPNTASFRRPVSHEMENKDKAEHEKE